MDDVTIRPRSREDDTRLVEVINSYEAIFPMTVKMLRHWTEERVRPGGVKPETYVAETKGGIAGTSAVEKSTWVKEPGVFYVEVGVDRDLWHQGIGTRLWEHLEPRTVELGATKLYARTAEDIPESHSFAERHGFRKTGRAERLSRLDVTTANLDGYEGAYEKLEAQGIRIKPMSELDESDEQFMRALHDTHVEGIADVPSTEEFQGGGYDTWRENFLKMPGSSPESFFVALHDGKPVGEANLFRHGDNHAANGFTGVARAYRGRGVARALKLRTIEWCRENGVAFIDTGNDAENHRMLAINVRLGYKPLPIREEWMKELPARS